MTLETPIESEAAETSEALTISEATTFSDYERIRRGESVPKAPSAKPSAPGAEKAPEQKESLATGTEETEGKQESESEGEESDEETEPKESEKPKKKGGFQRRIDKLNAAKTAAQQEAEYWRRMALEKSAGEAKKEAPKATTEASAGKPKADDFDTHAEFVEALTDWKTDQKLKAESEKQERKKLEAEQFDRTRAHQERVKAFAEKTDDFEEVLTNLDDIPGSPALEEIILSSDNGPELLYELAKNPEEAKRIAKLSPLAVAREMGKIEARLSAASSAEKKPETKKITKAAEPLKPVKASGKGAVAKSIGDPDLSFAEYERIRSEQLRQRRR